MKSIQIIFVFVLLNTACLLASAQNPIISKGKDHITFKVNTVEYSKTPFERIPYREALEHRVEATVEGMPVQLANDSLIPTGMHGFISAVHIAYAKHYPLVISPDMIWLLICQGLSAHINAHADSLRPFLVNHQDKICLKFFRPDFEKGNINNPWDNVFPELSDSVQKYLKADFYNQTMHSFSTTGSVEKAAYEVTFLECFKAYFDYLGDIACGIPEITLQGTTKDWTWIRDHVDFLRQYGLNTWVDAMNPVLDEFVNASEGKIDSVFWKSFYLWQNGCGTAITGWVCVFFPYSLDGINLESTLSRQPVHRVFFPAMFPSGMSRVPVTIVSNRTDTFKMEFVSGFMGVEQDRTTLAIKPAISYAVCQPIVLSKQDLAGNSDSVDLSVYSLIISDRERFGTLLDTLKIDLPDIFENRDYLFRGSYPLVYFSKYYFKGDTLGFEKLSFKSPQVKLGKGTILAENIKYLPDWVNKKISVPHTMCDIDVRFHIDPFGFISYVVVDGTEDTALKENIKKAIQELDVIAPGMLENMPVMTEIETTLHIR
jgi:hypothetical protein